MKIAYFDCFCGAAGDMILAAMVDAGLPVEVLQGVVERLDLPAVTLRASKVTRGGLAATHVEVAVGDAARTSHRHLPEILALIARAELPCDVVDRATRVFRRLGAAEARVHGTSPETVHFHEVGAADAIVDIVGACAGLHALGIERIVCSPIPTGSGVVRCEHGLLPVPPPATAELLIGVPIAASEITAELCTPTGAALLTTLASGFGPPPAMTVERVGYGAGTRAFPQRANVLRLILGDAQEAPDAAEIDVVAVLETHVDDMPGQAVAYALERVLAAGALDAFAAPIGMKKGRPGQLLTVLCRVDEVDAVEAVLFAETTTFGIRRRVSERRRLARTQVAVDTPFGSIRVKLGCQGGRVVQACPEYEDCAAAARAHGVPLRVVQAAARRGWTLREDRSDVERPG